GADSRAGLEHVVGPVMAPPEIQRPTVSDLVLLVLDVQGLTRIASQRCLVAATRKLLALFLGKRSPTRLDVPRDLVDHPTQQVELRTQLIGRYPAVHRNLLFDDDVAVVVDGGLDVC